MAFGNISSFKCSENGHGGMTQNQFRNTNYQDVAHHWGRDIIILTYLSCIFAVMLNFVVIWKLIDGGNRKVDKPETSFLNTRVLTRVVFAIFEKGPGRDNSFPTWSKTYGLENGSTGLAHIPAKPIVNARLARQVPRVRVVNSHCSSANI
jgi:hypothetical protein